MKWISPTTGLRTELSDSSAFSPGFGLVVKPLEHLSVYGNYIDGLTSPAPPVNAVNASAAFPAAVSRQTEIGAKAASASSTACRLRPSSPRTSACQTCSSTSTASSTCPPTSCRASA